MEICLFRHGHGDAAFRRSLLNRVLRWMRHPLREQVLFDGGRVPNLFEEYNFKVLLGPGLEPRDLPTKPQRSTAVATEAGMM